MGLLKLNTVRTMQDVGQGVERWSMLGIMLVATVLLAVKFKSNGHGDYFADLAWMFSVWLEAFALGPQVFLLHAKNHVDDSALHFAGLTLLASLTFAFFWGRNARDRSAEFQKYDEHGFFWAIGTACTIRVLLCAFYFVLF